MIARFGGRFEEAVGNIQNQGSLEYAVAQQEDEMKNVSLPDAAGRLAYRIITRHVFCDGNARTGMEAAFILLDLNGYEVVAVNDDIIETGQAASEGRISQDEFCSWVLGVCRQSSGR